uniref:Putative metalloprotease n=1 Tax=Ixodes ricinus TaxID=34613 RepID=A0A0K8R7G8_IXORI
MAPTDGGRNGGHFSLCSIAAFRLFVKTLKQDCFLVKSEEKHPQIPQELPGSTINATTLCKKTYSNFKIVRYHSNTMLEAQCKIECCIQDFGNYEYCYEKSMIDGMHCGGSKTCLRHKCGHHGGHKHHQPKTTEKPMTTTELTRPSTTSITKRTTPMPPAQPQPRPPSRPSNPYRPPAPPSPPSYPQKPPAPPSHPFNPHLPPAPPRRQSTRGTQRPDIPRVTRWKHIHEHWPAPRY